MGTLGLKDANFMVPIVAACKQYLRFQFRGVTFEFNCLPFGLNTAPYVFTKIMKPVIAHHLRDYLIYLDDFWLVESSYSSCLHNIKTTCRLLKQLDFIINVPKSKFVPTHNCEADTESRLPSPDTE